MNIFEIRINKDDNGIGTVDIMKENLEHFTINELKAVFDKALLIIEKYKKDNNI